MWVAVGQRATSTPLYPGLGSICHLILGIEDIIAFKCSENCLGTSEMDSLLGIIFSNPLNYSGFT